VAATIKVGTAKRGTPIAMEYLALLSFGVIVGTVALFIIGIQHLDYVCVTDVCEAEAQHYRDDLISKKETWFYVFVGFIIVGGVSGLIGLIRDTTGWCITVIVALFKTTWVGLSLCAIIFVLFIVACYELESEHRVPYLNCTVTCEVHNHGDSAHAFSLMILATTLLGLYICIAITLMVIGRCFFEQKTPYSSLSRSLTTPDE
jgi:hypothetical protein